MRRHMPNSVLLTWFKLPPLKFCVAFPIPRGNDTTTGFNELCTYKSNRAPLVNWTACPVNAAAKALLLLISWAWPEPANQFSQWKGDIRHKWETRADVLDCNFRMLSCDPMAVALVLFIWRLSVTFLVQDQTLITKTVSSAWHLEICFHCWGKNLVCSLV